MKKSWIRNWLEGIINLINSWIETEINRLANELILFFQKIIRNENRIIFMTKIII